MRSLFSMMVYLFERLEEKQRHLQGMALGDGVFFGPWSLSPSVRKRSHLFWTGAWRR